MNKLLVQTQLSNYDTSGKFILEADSGWQMVMGRVRVMLALDPELCVDVMCPEPFQLLTQPGALNADVVESSAGRLRFVSHHVIPNALATRYDFDFDGVSEALKLPCHRADPSRRYTHVYLNDPMHLRNFRALFYLRGGYRPKFLVHSHFIDNPECPKFPEEGSLWLGQCEAALRADYSFWQCESAMEIFFESMAKTFQPAAVASAAAKSAPWDDGYSTAEINAPVDMKNVRFDAAALDRLAAGRAIMFVPNRVGGEGRSSDYTNCGKFLFETCNRLWAQRRDFVVVAGNPSQKFTNDELAARCAPYLKLVDGPLNRDEYRLVGRHADVAVGLYDQDSYGGTAARELVDLGCVPLWIDRYEYARIAREVGHPHVARGFDDLDRVAGDLLDVVRETSRGERAERLRPLRDLIMRRCSYESTTPAAMRAAGLLA